MLLLLLPGALQGQGRCEPRPLAVVFSGGGAKGFAHIGVVETLERIGRRPDLIVGTSMGAIIGALYASGYPARVIDSLARALPLTSLFRSYQPARRNAWGALLPLVVWEEGVHGFALQTAAVKENEINALFNDAMLRGNLLARGDFDRLPIPFRAVATDLRSRDPVVLSGGDLAQAVRASATIPLIFPPEQIGSTPLVDGGLSANIPVGIARAILGPDIRVIVSDVTEHPNDTLDISAPVEVADQILGFLFRQPRDSIGPTDLWIRPEVDRFRSLDFSLRSMNQLIALGQAAGEKALGTWVCRPDGVSPRTLSESISPTPNLSPLPRLTLAALETANGDRTAEAFLEKVLRLGPGGAIDPEALRAALVGLGDVEPYRAVWLGPRGRPDSLVFDTQVRTAPRRVAGLGVAYDNELGGRIWVGVVNRFDRGARYEASGLMALGRLRRSAEASLRRNIGYGRSRTTPFVSIAGATEDVRDFTLDGVELEGLDTKEAGGFAGVEQRIGGRVTVRAGFDLRWWRDPADAGRWSTGGRFRFEWDDAAKRRPQLTADLLASAAVRRVVGELSPRFGNGDLSLQPIARVAWGEELPVQMAFPLGGDDGFPGLHLGERRGDREVYGGLQVSHRLKGVVAVRVLVAAGRTAMGGALLRSDGWLGGARAGLGGDTPIGPVAFEYGVATNGRGTAFVRVGRWF